MTLQDMVGKAVKRVFGPLQWEAAVNRIADQLNHTNEDIPKLVKEIQDDVVLKQDRITEIIYSILKPEIMKEAVRGLAKWYKYFNKEKDTSDDDIDIGTPAVA